MESNSHERNIAVTEEADGHPPDDTCNNEIYRVSQTPVPNSFTERVPIDTVLNNTKTQTSTMSTGEFANDTSKEDTTRLDINNSSIQNPECSSNPSPSQPITLPNSESPLPVITLTPVMQGNFESNSIEYLHYYITYNPDGTITAYPIYPYDPESPAIDHQSENQLPAFRVNLASDPSASQVYQFQDSASVTQAFSENNMPGSQISVQNNVRVPEVLAQSKVQVSQSNESLWQIVDQSNAERFQKNTQSSYTASYGNQNGTPVYQDVRSDAPIYQDVCSNTPVYEDDRSNVPVHQAVQSNDLVYQVAQRNDLIYQDVNSNSQVYQYDRSDTVHQEAQGNCAVYEGVQRNAPVYQIAQSHAPLYQYVQRNATMYQNVQSDATSYQDVQNNVPLYHDVQTSVPLYQDVQSHAPLYQDIQSNVPLYQNVHSSVPIYQDVPSHPPLNPDIQGNSTGQHDHNDGPEFEEQPSSPQFRHQQAKCYDSPSFTSWYGRHAAVESRLVAAVRTIALKNPNFIKLFQNRDKRFHRNNKTGAKADKVKADIPVSEMPLLSSPMSTSLNAASYPQTSPQVETQATDVPISEVPLPIGLTFTESSTQIQNFPEEKLTNSAKAFEINLHISPIPLSANTSDVTLSSAEPQLNSTQTQLNYPKSEISLPLDESSIQNLLRVKLLPSTVSRPNSAENIEINFRVSEMEIDPIDESHAHFNKLSIAECVPNNLTTNQTIVTAYDETRNKLEMPHTQESILKLPQELYKKIKSSKKVLSMSIVETEITPLTDTENKMKTQLKNTSASHNIIKEIDRRNKEISDVAKNKSDKPRNSSAEKNNSKVKNENKLNDSELRMKKLENKSFKTFETENESIKGLVLTKVDIKSDPKKDIAKTPQRNSGELIDAKEKAVSYNLKSEIRKKKDSPSQLTEAASEKETDGLPSSNTSNKIGIPKIQITDYDKPILSNEARAVSRLKANISPKDANAPEVKVAFIKPNTKKGLEQILFSKNCVTNVPPAVFRTIYRHRDTVQKFIEQGPGSEGSRRPLILSLDKADIQEITEQEPKEDATEIVALKTTPLTRKLRSKKKTVNKSPAEKDIRKDVEPDVTG